MIQWILYALAVALLLSAAAWLAERAARLRHGSTRWIWAAAFGLSLALPSIMSSVSVQLPGLAQPMSLAKPVALRDLAPVRWQTWAQSLQTVQHQSAARVSLPSVRNLCLVASCLLCAGLLLMGLYTRLLQRRWQRAELLGVSVLVAPDIGPAVVGLVRPRIVLPTWVMSAPREDQRLIVAHEQSHLAAHDPLLLTLALFLLVLMPWNLPLWWQFRRLRAAIEVDCDARILRAGNDARVYGRVLVDALRRRSVYLGSVAAMSESRPFLKRRLELMMSHADKRWTGAAAVCASLGVCVAAAATQISPPDAGASTERHAITLSADVLEGYAGNFLMASNNVMVIRRDGEHLLAQFGTQPEVEIYPQSSTEFFYKIVNAQISFEPDAHGRATALVLHQNGADTRMTRIDDATATQIADANALRYQNQTANPGSEPALRRMIAGFESGTPDYAEMSAQLVAATRTQLPAMQVMFKQWGALQSLQFRGVGNSGWDLYEAKYQNATADWRILLDSGGTVVGALVSAGP